MSPAVHAAYKRIEDIVQGSPKNTIHSINLKEIFLSITLNLHHHYRGQYSQLLF